jgi:hypothetical protein
LLFIFGRVIMFTMGDKVPTPTQPVPYRTDPDLLRLASDFLPPLAGRTPFTESRLAVLPDRTTVPVLFLLAVRKGGWDPETHFPFWLDGDSTNETLSNVGFALLEKDSVPRTGARARAAKARAKDRAARFEEFRAYWQTLEEGGHA